jgi:low molecular weight phosphotyrosine protein phosphatase
MAESVMKSVIAKSNDHSIDWEVDSAALADWNVGRSPEPRCLAVLKENGLTSEHIGRKVTTEDFYKFDYIFGMDEGNIEDLKELAPKDAKAQIKLLGCYNDKQRGQTTDIIQDPYFEIGIHGFRRSFDQILPSCVNFHKQVVEARVE